MFRNYIFIVFALLNTLLLKAQVAFESNVQLEEGQQPPLPGDPESNLLGPGTGNAVPVDQYVYILLVMTVAFGVFYFYRNRKAKSIVK